MRNCSKCKQSKPEKDYQVRKGRPSGQCRACKTLSEKNRRARIGIQPKKISRLKENFKECLLCNTFKEFSKFSKSARGSRGLSSYCKKCFSAQYKNRESNTEAVRKYRLSNRAVYLSQHRLHQFKRKTQIAAQTDGTVTDEFLVKVYDNPICYYCNGRFDLKHRTLEHKNPLSRGGMHSIKNIVMACFQCNSSKGSKTENEYRKVLNVNKS